jgi:signal transduction histidine kinase
MSNNNEFDRVLELSEYDLDYSTLQEHLEDLVKLAGKVAGTNVSMVNLIDHYTQWTISVDGMDIKQMPREDSVCQYTIQGDQPFEISDLSTDPRTKDREYVVNDKRLNFYFGIPLETKDGNNLGALCVLHNEARDLTPEKIEFLQLIADEVMNRLSTLKKMKELQNDLNKSNDTTRKVSHDIRGPVSGIIGVMDMIRNSVEEGNKEDILSLIDLVEKGSKSILELADSILSESDLFTNSGKNDESEFKLKDLENKLSELFSPQAVSKGLNLEIKCSKEYSNISIQKKTLLQICGNLISNAIKFTPEGGKVEIALTVKDEDEDMILEIKAKDTGEGIDQQKIDAILAGKASSSDGTVGEEGYGFGLKLVHHLVNQMEGSIEIDSEKGKGCKFIIELPI